MMNRWRCEIRNQNSALWQFPQRGVLTRQVNDCQTALGSATSSACCQQCRRLPLARPVSNVLALVIAFAALPERPDNLHPAVRQRPVSAGWRVPLAKLLLEVRLRPARMAQALPRQVVSSTTQGMRAGSTELDEFALAAAARDRNCTCDCLQDFGGGEALAVIADPRQQPCRGQRPFCAGKGHPPVRFGMGQEDLGHRLDECLFLPKEHPQHRNEHLDMFNMPYSNRSTRHGDLQSLVEQVKPLVDVSVVLGVQEVSELVVRQAGGILRGRIVLQEGQCDERVGLSEEGQCDRIVLAQIVDQLVSQPSLLREGLLVGACQLAQVNDNLALMAVGTAVTVFNAQQVGQQVGIPFIVLHTCRTPVGEDMWWGDVQVIAFLDEP